MEKKILLILIVVLILAAALGAAFYFLFWGKEEGGGSMFELFNKAQNVGAPGFDASKLDTNPMAGVPSANPLDKVANPFEDPYKNPFD